MDGYWCEIREPIYVFISKFATKDQIKKINSLTINFRAHNLKSLNRVTSFPAAFRRVLCSLSHSSDIHCIALISAHLCILAFVQVIKLEILNILVERYDIDGVDLGEDFQRRGCSTGGFLVIGIQFRTPIR